MPNNNCNCGNSVYVNNPCISGPFGARVLVIDSKRCPAKCQKVKITNTCLGISLNGLTNSCGRINFCNLPCGRYVCTLVNNPHAKSVSVRFEVNCCTPCANICLTTSALKCSGRIFIKLVGENPKPLEGGTFKLFKEDGTYVGERTTDKNGETSYSNLGLGTYYLIQTKAPSGYVKDPKKYKITLNKNKKCATITIVNEKKQCGCICLCLKSCKCHLPICGAKFALYKCGKKIDCQITNKKGCLLFKHLEVPGKYYIKQLTTKPGFEKIKHPICVILTPHEPCKKVCVCNTKKLCNM